MNKSIVTILIIALITCSACTAKENEQHDIVGDVIDLDVIHSVEMSSNGLYRIESFGIMEKITAAGLYPAEGIRLVKVEMDEELWSMTPGYYKQSFLWSPNDRYVAIYVEARTYGETIVVDTKTMTELSLPTIEQLRHSLNTATTINEDRADPYLKHTKWLSNDELSVTFQWTGEDDIQYVGVFTYHVTDQKLLDTKLIN